MWDGRKQRIMNDDFICEIKTRKLSGGVEKEKA